MLAATLTTAIVFFPVTFLYGVSRFLFTALALAVVLSLFASYFVAMTVVPLFCAQLIKGGMRSRHAAPRRAVGGGRRRSAGRGGRLQARPALQPRLQPALHRHARSLRGALGRALLRPAATVLGITGMFCPVARRSIR